MNRKVIILNGLSVRYYEAGEGPPLILLHGAGGTARLWHRQVGPLSKSFRIIAPDLPGFGGSGASPDINSVRGYAKFLAGFMDALGIVRATIVGSSMGGWAACWFAIDFPERTDRLVLISPAGFVPDLAGHLSGIRAVTLIIWGSQDRVIPVSYAEAFGKEITGSSVKVIEGAGHLPYVERPEEVNGLISEFLSS